MALDGSMQADRFDCILYIVVYFNFIRRRHSASGARVCIPRAERQEKSSRYFSFRELNMRSTSPAYKQNVPIFAPVGSISTKILNIIKPDIARQTENTISYGILFAITSMIK